MLAKYIAAKALIVIVFLCSALTQDFEPDPLEPLEFDTTTSTSSQATATGISTDSPTTNTEIATESTTTVTTTTSTSISTPISISTEISSSTPQVVSTTNSAISVKPDQLTTLAPFFPSKPAQCYFKKQRGPLKNYWTCQGLQWIHVVECYYCCREENSMFAGCNRVDFSYCEWYN